MTWLKTIFEPIASIIKEPIVEWQKRKTLLVLNEEKVAERDHEIRVKKADAVLELSKLGITTEADWDREAQQQMKTSWKDEYLLILFSIPLIGAFMPWMQPYILEGFRTLAQMPDWYMWLIVGMVCATFGLRWMFRKINFGGK